MYGNFDDGNGSWNSQSVKYILTNRTYTGMLVQGKEKRAVEATHEPLVDSSTFDATQKSFQARAYDVLPQGQSADNILKGKAAYEKQYAVFRKLLPASSRDISLSEIVYYIDKVVVDKNGKIVVKWHI